MNQICLYKQLALLKNKIDSITELCHRGFFNLVQNDYDIERDNYIDIEKEVSIFYYSFFDLLVKNKELLGKLDQSILKHLVLLQRQTNTPLLSGRNIDFRTFSDDVYKVVVSINISIEKILTEYVLSPNVRDFILKNIDSIYSLCSKYFLKSLFVYGSILTKRFTSDSDIDFLYEIDINRFKNLNDSKYDYVDNILEFEQNLSMLLKRKIDLIPNIAISNIYLKESIDQSKQLLYAA